MRKRKTIKDVFVYCILLVLVLVILYSGLRILESTVLHQSEVPAQQGSTKTITRDDVDYFPRQDITVMMVLDVALG